MGDGVSSFAGSLAKLLERSEASILYEQAAKRIANIIDKKKEAIYMDKNPKHPLKKRKVQQKVNLTAENGEEEHASGKHKKHYE